MGAAGVFCGGDFGVRSVLGDMSPSRVLIQAHPCLSDDGAQGISGRGTAPFLKRRTAFRRLLRMRED